jgi:hypothetical protein
MWLTPLTVLSTLALPLTAYARSSAGDRVLVVADKSVKKADYSGFLDDLKGASLGWRNCNPWCMVNEKVW